ncbi:MAG: tyrosine-type recombinase/integrase [Dehalococcoidia bacterium]
MVTKKDRSRRPRGEGSITREGDRWVVRMWVGQHRLKRTTRTQAEALVALDEIKRKAVTGLPVGRYTVAETLDDFLSHGQSSRGWAPSTYQSYESAARMHIRPVLGKRMLADLSVRDVQRLMSQMITNGHSGRYVAHVRGVLRAAIAHAMRSEIVHRNVAALAAPPPVRRAEMRALSATEIRSLFAALEGERLRPLIVTGATLGLRRGELMALRWSDVDLDAATLTVRRTGKRIGKAYVEGQPKSERSRRAISLPPAIVAMLRAHSAAIAAERLRLGPAWLDEDRVFPGEGGGPVGQTTIRKALDRGLTRAKLSHIRVHDLRHTAATQLLAAGGSLRDAQEMLGHSSYSLTADTYAHVLDDQRKATADRIQQALGGAIGGV